MGNLDILRGCGSRDRGVQVLLYVFMHVDVYRIRGDITIHNTHKLFIKTYPCSPLTLLAWVHPASLDMSSPSWYLFAAQ